MSWLSSFLHPDRGYKAGQEQLDKYYHEGQNEMQPYNTNGQAQGLNLSEMIKNLMDPQALQDKWSKGYQESEAAKANEGIAQEHGMNAASGMGLMGSNSALNAVQKGTSNIAMQDKQNYLNDLMEKYKTGAGLSQGMYNTGASTASNMGQNAMNMGNNSAQMAFGQQNAPGEMLGKMGGAVGKLLISYLTGGMGTGGMGRGSWQTGGS